VASPLPSEEGEEDDPRQKQMMVSTAKKFSKTSTSFATGLASGRKPLPLAGLQGAAAPAALLGGPAPPALASVIPGGVPAPSVGWDDPRAPAVYDDRDERRHALGLVNSATELLNGDDMPTNDYLELAREIRNYMHPSLPYFPELQALFLRLMRKSAEPGTTDLFGLIRAAAPVIPDPAPKAKPKAKRKGKRKLIGGMWHGAVDTLRKRKRDTVSNTF
jgi:hypothetical protein